MSDNKKKPYQPPQKYGLCIDWETSGATWGGDSSIKYQGIAFGAIVFDTATFEPVEKLYREVKFNPDKWEWTEGAQKVHGLTIEHLEEHGVTQEEAATDLLELILKYFGPESKVMFLGHNPGFDIRFTDQLLASVEFEFSVEKKHPEFTQIQLHHVVLDTSALGFITFGLYKSDLLFDKIGFEQRGDHNALQDAEQTLQTCQVVQGLVQLGLTA
jgi:hypothetical protein